MYTEIRFIALGCLIGFVALCITGLVRVLQELLWHRGEVASDHDQVPKAVDDMLG